MLKINNTHSMGIKKSTTLFESFRLENMSGKLTGKLSGKLSARSLFFTLTTLVILITSITLANTVLAHGDDDHSKDAKDKKTSTSSMTSIVSPQRLSDGSLFIPKSIQRQLGIRTQVANIKSLAASVELNGKVIADPDTGGRVQATFSGTLQAPKNGMPSLGRKVVKGEVLAYLKPIDTAIERGNQKANLADIESKLEIVSRQLARYEKIASVIPLKELETTRIERDSLIRQRSFVSSSLNASEPLLASATGTISASYVVAGQVVDAKEILFDIVDTSRLVIEALDYDTSNSTMAYQFISASAMTDDSQQVISLTHIGTGQQLRDQALPILFRVNNNKNTKKHFLTVGQSVKVIAQTQATIQGASILRSAISKGKSGENMVWVHTEAERFVPLRITQTMLDANTIAITQGIHEGDRVVTIGASLLSEVR